jgi:hypothetical protein
MRPLCAGRRGSARARRGSGRIPWLGAQLQQEIVDRITTLVAQKAAATEEGDRWYAAWQAERRWYVAVDARAERLAAEKAEAEGLLRDCWPVIDGCGAGWLRARWPAHLRAPKDA